MRKVYPPKQDNKPKKPREKSVVVEDKQKAFADAILEGKSQADAARIAGYHPATAHKVMRQENIQSYLAEARQEITDISTIKRMDVIEVILEAIDMARTLADPAQMINGADKMAKIMGFYAPETMKLEVTQNTAVLSQKYKQLSDEELFAIASGRAKVIEGEVIE